jgi:hypothetical protein
MKRQFKFKTEADVLKQIDAAHRKIKRLEMAAQTHLDLADLARGADLKESCEHDDEATLLLGKIDRLKNTRLKRLGSTLAALRTIPLGETAGVAGLNEAQVVLENVK